MVVDAAMRMWRRNELCFTDAYGPPRRLRHTEARTRQKADMQAAERIYWQVCDRLKPLWDCCGDIANLALSTRSWRKTTRAIMRVPGYGGTGFLAKELVQDLMHTPLFQVWNQDSGTWDSGCVDVDSWCIVGHGARRGLNRLHSRRVDKDSYNSSSECQEYFLKELLTLFKEREGR